MTNNNKQLPNYRIFFTLLLALFPAIYLVLINLFSSSTTTPATPQVHVLVEDLLNPLGMVLLPNGNLLIAEEGTGNRDDSAGVSLMTPNGQIGRLISGFSSTRDSGDLAGVPFVQLSPDKHTIYVGHFGDGHLWTLPVEQAKHLPTTPFTPTQLSPAMLPLNNVFLVNPFDLTFDATGLPVVSDATGNGVAKQNPDGTTRFIHRFANLTNPTAPNQTANIQPVPTGITRIGSEYYVTLTGGCPYPRGGGQLVAIDENRQQRTVLTGLNMPIDVAQGPDGTIWLLEFARFTPGASCFDGSGYQARTGRLSRLLPSGQLEAVLTDLNFPAAILPLPDGSLYLSEIFPGRILHITFKTSPFISTSHTPRSTSHIPHPTSYTLYSPPQYDHLLQNIIQTHQLAPDPGRIYREEESQLTQLGQALFFDPILSGDQNISCATCHHPYFAMADGRSLPIGTGGHTLGPNRHFVEQITLGPEADFSRRLAGITDLQTNQTTVSNPFNGLFIPRNSPSIINSALFPSQFWDSRIEKNTTTGLVKTQETYINNLNLTDPLLTQALFPIISQSEMAGATFGALAPQTIRVALVQRLQAIPTYVNWFQQVFGTVTNQQKPIEAVTLTRMAEAIAAFERQFIFTHAPWDDYLAGQQTALSLSQKRGALLFFGELNPAINCVQCHQGNLFTDFQHHNLLVPQLGPGKGHGYTKRADWGRAAVTFDWRDRYKFRTPSLRNVTLTAPYFHDGAFDTLEATIRHHANIKHSAQTYDPAINNIPPALYSSLQPFNFDIQGQTIAPALASTLPLSEADIADLVAFLHSLTDPNALDLTAFIPERVPSGLNLDPLPEFPPSLNPRPNENLESASKVSPPLQEINEGQNTGLQFHNVASSVGLNFTHGAFQTNIFQDPVAMMGGGLCWLDYNQDGWLDLYLVNSYAEDEQAYWQQQGGLPTNALYHNKGGSFVDVSIKTGTNLAMRGNGCVAADFNRDGWPDLYLTNTGPNVLLWNNGDGTFTEGTQLADIAASEWNSAAVVGDLNNDGWPDLFVAAYLDFNHKIPKPSGAFPQDYYGLPDRLYLNLGVAPGKKWATFQEVTDIVGLKRAERGLGAILSDLDNDGDLDLYIANDGHPNRLYANEPWPNGIAADPEKVGFRFIDLADSANVGDSGSGMGVTVGDYDGDEQSDLFITNWERELNALYRNELFEKGHLTFQYSTYRIGVSGLGNGLTGWGTALSDFDHDTDLDLLIVNGRVPVTNLATDGQLVHFYRNLTHNSPSAPNRPGQFLVWTEPVGLKKVGPLMARGSAVADYDNDGDLDIAINTIANPMVLLQANNTSGYWLQIVLDGFYPGAKATLGLPNGQQLHRELFAGSSYLASEDPRFHFGLGSVQKIPYVVVTLLDGRQFTFEDVVSNQQLFINTNSLHY